MDSITAKSTLVGLIGWPVRHSVSPAMHNAAFDHMGLDWCYVPLPVNPEPPERLGEAVRGLAALGLRGVNVTVPHKRAVMPFLDKLTAAARAIGAVNTIVVAPDGALAGDNTDAPGFIADLNAHAIDPAGMNVLVLGAGGAARAVVYGLANASAERIAILNRTIERGQELAVAFRSLFPRCEISACRLPEDIQRLVAGADLIVNCTALGMAPHVDATPWDERVPFRAGQIVYDLVYNPPVTCLMRKATADGAQTIGGLGMLIWQGVLAFDQWTGFPAPVDIMRAAAAARFASAREAGQPERAALHVRRAGVEDAVAISALNTHMQQIHVAAHPEYFKAPSEHTFPPELVTESMEKPDNHFWVAEIDGHVTGYLYADTTPPTETRSTRAMPRVYIHHISVDPAQQRKGCGAALMQAAREFAREQHIDTLALSVWGFNHKARQFFEKQGFVTYNHRMWLQKG